MHFCKILFRFFAVEDSWLSKIYLSNCTPEESGRCAVVITARPLGIPFSEKNLGSYFLNCTLTDLCMLQMIPAIGNWNYISVQSLKRDMEFTLVIETEGIYNRYLYSVKQIFNLFL